MHARMRLLGILVILVSLTACDAWTSVRGTIRNDVGRPISGATITLKVGSESRQFTSVEDGEFVASVSQPPWKTDIALTVSKPGYWSFEKQLKGPGQFKDFDVVLQKLPPEPQK